MKTKHYTRFAMLFSMLLLFSAATVAQVTIEVPLLTDDDAAEEVMTELEPEGPLGSIDIGGSDLEICFDHEPQYVGLLFRNLDIPYGATIEEATIQFQVDAVDPGTSDAPIDVNIQAALLPTIDSIYDEDFGISKHPLTTASVVWEPEPSQAEGDRTDREKTANFAVVLQEVIDQLEWAAGNNVLIVFTDDPNLTDDVNREFETGGTEDDGSPSPENPVLSVTFTVNTSINDASARFVTSVYPNPAKDAFYINNPAKGVYSYELFSITGQSVAKRDNLRSGTVMVDVAGLSKGVYFVGVQAAGKSEIHKLVIE